MSVVSSLTGSECVSANVLEPLVSYVASGEVSEDVVSVDDAIVESGVDESSAELSVFMLGSEVSVDDESVLSLVVVDESVDGSLLVVDSLG